MKEEKMQLILGSHSHVPSGAPESEFQSVYNNKIRPFISTLYRYSNIQAVLHYSGVLLYWIERTHPEIFMLIEDMVGRKQVEILSGGFYEPILPLIPLQDRIGQIELMTTYLRKHFGKRPQGCWIPGFVWEQHAASSLASSDMLYTFLSQEQFVKAGFQGEELFAPCITEDQGKIITVFPVSLSIMNALSEKSVSQVFIELINSIEASGSAADKIITVFPEKISSSAQEAEDTAWHRFFEELSLSKDLIETVLPLKTLKGKAFKKAAFPNSSYFENDFSPRRFIIDHCESNGIYSKMVFTNVLINQLKGDRYRKQNAREELWKAQDSCLFTPSNGYLRNELRKAAYSSMLRAERLSREKGKFTASVIQHDFDLDGVKETLFQDAKINCYIQLKGAGIFEFDYLPKDWNYLDCGSASFASMQLLRRTAFADVLAPLPLRLDPQLPNLHPDAEFYEFTKKLVAGARLCFNEQFEVVSQTRGGKTCLKLPALGAEKSYGNIEIGKCYTLKRDILTVSYSIKNTGNKKEDFYLITGIGFSFAGNVNGEEYVRFYTADSEGKDIPAENILDNIISLKIHDIKNEVQILLSSVKPFSGCLQKICTGGFYQADRILSQFAVSLEAGETWTNDFSLKFSH